MEGKEERRPIKDFENYEISSLGQVHNTKTGRMLKLTTKGGYMFTGLSEKCKGKTISVHRLVALAFIENPENKPCVDHIDNDKSNNNVNNLRWATLSEN